MICSLYSKSSESVYLSEKNMKMNLLYYMASDNVEVRWTNFKILLSCVAFLLMR